MVLHCHGRKHLGSNQRRVAGRALFSASFSVFFSIVLSIQALAANPSWMPKRMCSDVLKRSELAYNYSKDARQTELGNEGYEAYQSRVNRKSCLKPWTVLVYMAADNDLTPYALMDLYEMEAGFVFAGSPKVGSTERSDLLVQLDTKLSLTTRRLHMFQTPEAYKAKLMPTDVAQRTERDIRSPIVMTLNESPQDDSKKRLQEFLSWGVREYPSEHYMVVIWGHGQGWTSVEPGQAEQVSSHFLDASDLPEIKQAIDESQGSTNEPVANLESEQMADQLNPFVERGFGGLAFSDSNKTYLSIPTLSEVLDGVAKNDLEGKSIDVYASDACLMQMAEVAYEISGSTRYIVGSTQVQNYFGLPYRRIMTELNTGRFGALTKQIGRNSNVDEAYLLAKMIPKVFKASMKPRGSQGRFDKSGLKTITMSAINSSELREFLMPQLLKLSTAISNYISEDKTRAIDIQYVLQTTPSFIGGAEDIGAFLTLLENLLSNEAREKGSLSLAASQLQVEANKTKDILNRTVTAFALGSNYSDTRDPLYLLGFRAFSVWLPTSPGDYNARIRDFRKSALFRLSHDGASWSNWIDQLYSQN